MFAMFKISTLEKKNVTQIDIWKKDGVTLYHTTGWRWGTVTVAEAPDLSKYDEEEGIDIYQLDVDDHELDDGVYEDWEYVSDGGEQANLLEEEVNAQVEENGFVDLDELGWDNIDTEVWFRGPLEVTEK